MLMQIRATIQYPTASGSAPSHEKNLTDWLDEEHGKIILDDYMRKFDSGRLPEVKRLYVVTAPQQLKK